MIEISGAVCLAFKISDCLCCVLASVGEISASLGSSLEAMIRSQVDRTSCVELLLNIRHILQHYHESSWGNRSKTELEYRLGDYFAAVCNELVKEEFLEITLIHSLWVV